MPIQFDKFDQQKVDRIKTHLEAQASKGSPKFFEIYVDSLKAVQKTDEPKEFDGYENYMTASTNEIKIVIYNSGASPRNDQFVFSLRAKTPQEALENGLDGFSTRSLSKGELLELKEKRETQLAENEEIADLRSEIEELEKELTDKNTYITQLEDKVEEAEANGNKIGGIKIGDLLADTLGGLVRKNTHILAQIPGLDGIAQIIEQENARQNLQSTTPDSDVKFKKKDGQEQSPAFSEEEKQILTLFKELQKRFSEEEMTQVFEIIDRLSRAKEKINTCLELIKA